MADPGWKQVERRVARYLGSERNPGSGASGTGTRSDSQHPYLFIETKHGKQAVIGWAAAERLFERVRERAAVEGKEPVLVLHPPRIGGGIENYPAYVDLLGIVVQVPLRRVRQREDLRVLVAPALARQSAGGARPGSPSDTSGSTPPPP